MGVMLAPFGKEHWADVFGDWPQWRKKMGLGPHRGQDFNRLAEGTPIPASGSGRVTHIEWNNVLGHVVVIAYGPVHIGYCHMRERTPLSVGDLIMGGVTVGRLGNTGSASTGAHLHMTASYSNGSPGIVPVIDPMQFFTGSSTASGAFVPLETVDPYKIARESETSMFVRLNPAAYTPAESKIVYEVWRNPATGKSELLWLSSPWLAAAAANLAIPCDAETLSKIGRDLGYKFSTTDPAVLTARA